MKNMIRKIVLRLWPELGSGAHLPQLAIVVGVPDPPANGETHSHERPFYAVNCRLLKKDFSIDADMPVMRDVPVAMTGAAAGRGLAALPGEGTIVEIAFAFGCQSKPFIRTVLPFGMQLPAIDKRAMRLQQSAASFQEVDAAGNWTRQTSGSISDQAKNISGAASAEWTAKAPKVWIGNASDNALKIDSDLMAALMAALDTLSSHTHPEVGTISQGAAVTAQKEVIQTLKIKLDLFVKQ
ncbi:MAG: hypothetical protein PHV82_11480 [Victivallaceae bacterium]|nr:hypothetical protein [Victivallaceae bacterium]